MKKSSYSPPLLCTLCDYGRGRGTRLYPLTKLRCKPAVPLGGKYRLVDIPISNCINSGYNKIYLLSQFNTESLHRHVSDAYRFDRFGRGYVEILSAEQTEHGDDWYQGTADAVRRNMIHFHASPEDIFVILSGDQLYRMDFSKMVEEHLDRGADVTVAAKPVPVSDASGLGLLRVGEDSKIVDFVEKPTDPEVIARLVPPELKASGGEQDRCLASMGIYVFNATAMEEALRGDATDFGKEIIPSLVSKKDIRCHILMIIGRTSEQQEHFLMLIYNLPMRFHRLIFTRASIPYTIDLMFCLLPSLVSVPLRTTIAAGSMIGESALNRCVLAERSIIGQGCKLESVVMMGADFYDDCRNQDVPRLGVGNGTHIENAIIDKNARIGKDIFLSPKGLAEGWVDEGENVYVRDGILIVTKNGVVKDGTKIGNQ